MHRNINLKWKIGLKNEERKVSCWIRSCLWTHTNLNWIKNITWTDIRLYFTRHTDRGKEKQVHAPPLCQLSYTPITGSFWQRGREAQGKGLKTSGRFPYSGPPWACSCKYWGLQICDQSKDDFIRPWFSLANSDCFPSAYLYSDGIWKGCWRISTSYCY